MKSKLILLVSMLITLSLLAACGNASGVNNQVAGHESHGEQKPADSKGEEEDHSGHGGDQKPSNNEIKAAFTFEKGGAKAEEVTELTINITEKDGEPINDFELNHEKLHQ